MNPFKVTGLTVEGFRQMVEEHRFDLRTPSDEPLPHLVIAGPNGSGKTTVLDAFVLGLGRDLALQEVDPERPGETFGLRDSGRIQVDLLDPDTRERYSCERSATRFSAYKQLDGNSRAILAGQELSSLRSRLRVDYLRSNRRGSWSGAITAAVRRELRAEDAGRMWVFKDRLYKQMVRRVPGYKGPEPHDAVWTARLNEIWRTFRDDGTELVLTLVDPSDLDADAWDLFLYRGDERLCTFDDLSSGEREVLELLVPYVTEVFDGLLLVDEPELHLHPQWQARVVRALRAATPSAQVFVATHADDPWDDAMSWERIFLAPPGDPRLRVTA